MKELKQQISIILKELEEMIKNKVDKNEIEEKRKELDKSLEKYLKNFK